MDSTGVTEYLPGPYLSRLGQQRVVVTRPGNDDVGKILTSMNVEFVPFQGTYECTLLFINCGTPDQIDPLELAEFVRGGGCLYASDHADSLISQAFPGVFDFGGHSGAAGQVTAEVIDPELREVLGQQIHVSFDMPVWAVLQGGKDTALLVAANGSQQAGSPLMAYAEYGQGSIFFTCFHNNAQISAHEKKLLQLLVVKQFSAKSKQSFEQTGKSLGLILNEMRSD